MLLEILLRNRFLFNFFYRLIYLRGSRHIRRERLVYNYLKQHLDWANFQHQEFFINPRVRKNKTIWVMWTQGINSAPLLVQKCYATIDKFKEDFDVVLLTKENICQYIRLPEFVEELYQKGHMSEALHSDMIRLYLMICYGGIWRDATCYQSSPLPDFIHKAPFFMFSASMLSGYTSPIKCSSWFIKSNEGNPLLIKTYSFLCEYHRRFKTPHDYYIFHLVLSVLVDNDFECRQIWEQMPYVCNMNPHVLLYSFKEPYRDDKYNQIISSCFIHKLTYKFDSGLLNTNNVLRHFMII